MDELLFHMMDLQNLHMEDNQGAFTFQSHVKQKTWPQIIIVCTTKFLHRCQTGCNEAPQASHKSNCPFKEELNKVVYQLYLIHPPTPMCHHRYTSKVVITDVMWQSGITTEKKKTNHTV